MRDNNYIHKLLWLAVFAIAMAFVEAAIVVYLRAIYYPDGFTFPLRAITDYKIVVEVLRETATVFMLLSVAFLAGKNRWERFAYFMYSFGLWDIFYYVWLKVLVKWPASLFDWDILFLIPLPWISPVIAPVSISLLMIIFSILILRLIHKGNDFKPTWFPIILALSGITLILYSFMCDVNATLHQQMPRPYHYDLLIAGNGLFIAAFLTAYARCRGNS
jgi:hypothetical protein